MLAGLAAVAPLHRMVGMTRFQGEILERIASLAESDRRALVEHLIETHLGGERFLKPMTPEHNHQLKDGMRKQIEAKRSPQSMYSTGLPDAARNETRVYATRSS